MAQSLSQQHTEVTQVKARGRNARARARTHTQRETLAVSAHLVVQKLLHKLT